MAALRNRVKLNPGLFPEGTLEKLNKVSPEGRKQAAEDKDGAKVADDVYRQFDEDEREWQQYQKRRKKWVDETAKAIKESSLGVKALNGKLTEEDVKTAMNVAGISESRVNSTSGEVFRSVKRQSTEDVQERALKDGTIEAFASMNLEKDFKDKQEQKEQQAKSRRLSKARDKLPGVDEMAEAGALQAMIGNPAALQNLKAQITEALKTQGMSAGDAQYAADDLAEDATKKVQEKGVRKALEGPDMKDRTPRASETFRVADLNRQAQQGVSDDPFKRETKAWRDKMYELIASQQRAGNNVLQLKVT